MLECPQFDDIRAQYPDLLQDARDSMRDLMWHQNQKALSDFVIAILDEPRTWTRTRPHRPCWPNGRSESLSLRADLAHFKGSMGTLAPSADSQRFKYRICFYKACPQRCTEDNREKTRELVQFKPH